MIYTAPCSFSLEKSLLLLPEAITTIVSMVATINQLLSLLKEEGVQALKNIWSVPNFPIEVIPCIQARHTARVPNKIALHYRAANSNNEKNSSGNEIHITYHGYIMQSEGIWNSKECISKRVDNLTTNWMFTAVATLLDTKHYHGKSADAVHKASMVIACQSLWHG